MVENRDDGQLELSLRLGQNPSNMITNSKKVYDHRNPIWNRPVLQSQGYLDIADVNSSKAEKFSLRGVDMNWTPPPVEWEEGSVDGGCGPQPSPPYSTVSSLSGKRSERELRKALSSPGSCNDDFGGGGAAFEEEETASAKKKLRLSKEQTGVLEGTFKTHNTINPKQKVTLAQQLNLSPRQVEVWFQNRRARTKLKQAEVDCQYLKRCCEKLSGENKRLQKEVQELRALKHSPQHLCMHMPPATNIAMCPSCDRARAASSAPSSSSAAAVTTATDWCNQLLLGQGYTRSTPIRSTWGVP